MPTEKMIKSPEIMWSMFEDYIKHVKGNPFKKTDYKGSDVTPVVYEIEKPLTLEGFENYVATIDGMPKDLGGYFANSNGNYSEYSTICKLIRKKIRQDQIEGGMAGLYNSSITQRLNNLVERREIKTEDAKPDLSGLTEDEILLLSKLQTKAKG